MAKLDHAMIARLLKPKSVAVVGASEKPGALGATLISNLDRAGYTGAIYPINPNRATIGARACLPSVDALPEGVDVAVLAIPRAGVMDAVKALAARKVGSAIIFAAGFAAAGTMAITVERHHNGLTLWGTDRAGCYVHRLYIGYTVKQARSAFRSFLRGE